MIQKIRNWLILIRAHTVVLEAPMAFLGAAIGLGTIYDPRVGLWLGFGVLYHVVGYSMNSYTDWKKGFDKDDERKQHHPLNTGDITPESAKKFVYALTGLLFVYTLALTYPNLPAVGLAFVMVGSGLVYNYFGKYITVKAIPISVAHTLVFFIPFYTYSSTVPMFVVLMTAAYFIHHIFQIAVSGDIKDIDQDEASLLDSMGAYVEDLSDSDADILHTSESALIFSYLITVMQIGLAVGATVYIANGAVEYIPVALLACAVMGITDRIVRPGPFARSKRLSYIAQREIFGYLMIHLAALAVLTPSEFIAMVACMFIYLVSTSKFMWGNFLVPEV